MSGSEGVSVSNLYFSAEASKYNKGRTLPCPLLGPPSSPTHSIPEKVKIKEKGFAGILLVHTFWFITEPMVLHA